MPMKIETDYHIHTRRSACGKEEAKLQDIVPLASAAGLKEIGIADHVFVESDLNSIDANREDIKAMHDLPLSVLVGCEAEMHSPTDCTISAEAAAEMDFVIIAANHFHLDAVQDPPEYTPEAYAAHCTGMTEAAIDTGFCDIIPHPFNFFLPVRWCDVPVWEDYDQSELNRVLEKAAEADVAFELNLYALPAMLEFAQPFIQAAKKHNLKFSLGSDSHNLRSIGYRDVDSHIAATPMLLEELGVSKGDIFRVPS